MDDKTKIEQATIAKEKGTNRLKSKHIRLAIQHYSRILSLLDHMETKVSGLKVLNSIFFCITFDSFLVLF